MATSHSYQCLDIINPQIMLVCFFYLLPVSFLLYSFLHILSPNYNLTDPVRARGPMGSSSPRVYELYFEGSQEPMEDYPEDEQMDGLSSLNSKFQQCPICPLNSTGITYKCVTKEFTVRKECLESTKSSTPCFIENETALERGNGLPQGHKHKARHNPNS